MPIKELIIGAAPRSTVADYIKDIDNWEDARLAVAESHMDSYDVPDLLTWGSEFISVKNLKQKMAKPSEMT